MEIFRIDGEIHSSKNARQIFRANNGRTYVVKSDASKNDEQMMDVQLLQQKTLWDDIVTSLTFPLYVNFVFFRKSRRRWDFANLVQGVADAMVKAGYLPDDDVDHFVPVYAGHEVDKDNPGVEFWVKEKKG